MGTCWLNARNIQQQVTALFEIAKSTLQKVLTQYLLSNSNSVVDVFGQTQWFIEHLRVFDSCLAGQADSSLANTRHRQFALANCQSRDVR